MDIELNGEKLDIILEKEKNLQEVMEGLEKWLLDSELVITAVTINGEEMVSTAQGAWAKRPLEEIQHLGLSAAPLREVACDIIDTARQYLTMLTRGIETADSKLLAELKPGFPYMLETIEHLSGRGTSPAWQQELIQWLQALKIKAVFTPDAPGASQIPGLCTQILRMLEKLNSQEPVQTAPLSHLPELRKQISGSIEKMNEVSILLQTGKDKEAMEIIIGFTEQMQTLQHIFSGLKESDNFVLADQQIAGQSPEAFYTQLNTILKELIAAFDIKDYVLIGDLLEYEIAPKMKDIIHFTGELEQFRGGNVRT